jgi:predicted HTH domain antitoxin
MPPIRSQNRSKLIEQEGRILAAIQAIEKQEKLSIRRAAEIYDIPRTTLQDRLSGRRNRVELRANSIKLTEIEENSLKQWIISMDIRGAAPRPAMVQEMANLLLATRGTTPIQTIGKNWVSNYVKRHPELDTRFSRRYNYNRAKCEDPKIIMQWFELVQKTIYDYGINSDDIYNFDETGFAMGMTATAKVITRAEYYGRRSILQPGNREWVTSIECVGASGYCLPPMVIFKGKVIIKG